MATIVHRELSYRVRGVLLKVYNELGPMLPERFYQDAVALGLEACGIRHETEKAFEVFYRDVRVGLYLVDVWIEGGKIILELKVAPGILPIHKAQALSYLKVTGADLAVIVNYGTESLQDERLPNFLRDKIARLEWEEQPAASLPYPDLTHSVLRALHQVHFELGPGFLHQVYRRATMVELESQGLNYEYMKQMPICYEGHCLGLQPVRLICIDEKILLATVAVRQVDSAMQAQLKARLKHLDLQMGLLANFGGTALQMKAVRR